MKHNFFSLYVCFVDFKRAFDSVVRKALLHKLLKKGIGGKFFNLITNMYSNTMYSFTFVLVSSRVLYSIVMCTDQQDMHSNLYSKRSNHDPMSVTFGSISTWNTRRTGHYFILRGQGVHVFTIVCSRHC